MDIDIDADQLAVLRSLEEAMWKSDTRGDRAWMDSMISPEFTEHGASGRAWGRLAILDMQIPDHIAVEFPLRDFTARVLGDGVVLVTYVCVGAERLSNRSSIWRYDGDHWLMEFHQGTPVPIGEDL